MYIFVSKGFQRHHFSLITRDVGIRQGTLEIVFEEVDVVRDTGILFNNMMFPYHEC